VRGPSPLWKDPYSFEPIVKTVGWPPAGRWRPGRSTSANSRCAFPAPAPAPAPARPGPALYVPVRCLNVLNDAAKYVWVILSERNPNVPIEIKRESNQLYAAVASRPDIDQNRSTSLPFMVDELISELLARGGHHTDIADAFYAANPNWLSK
jgi:hypothetical protein